MSQPLLALTVGDPAGVGPEISLHAAARPEVRAAARLVLIGPRALRPPSIDEIARDDVGRGGPLSWLPCEGPDEWQMGEVQAPCGAAAVSALRLGHELALERRVDALVTAPVNKAALHAAGTKVEGQTELLAGWCGVERFEMIGIAGALRVMLLTRHMPLAEAVRRIGRDARTTVPQHLALFDETLRGTLGIDAPRIAVAGLNPHAGEGGILGAEELDVLAPAIEAARKHGIDATGPISPDSVFHEAREGRWDGVLALYHDQAFIPLKLLAEGRGITVIAGLPYLRLSPMHGTAFDIAGQGIADPTNLVEALLRAAEICRRLG